MARIIDVYNKVNKDNFGVYVGSHYSYNNGIIYVKEDRF